MPRELFAALFALGLGGCVESIDTNIPEPARTALANADTFELLSLEPGLGKGTGTADNNYRGWKVLGRITPDRATCNALRSELNKAIKVFDGKRGDCFIPRHAIQIIQDGKTVDFVICFECSQVEVFVGHEHLKTITMTGSPRLFDQTLRDAGVPLASPPR